MNVTTLVNTKFNANGYIAYNKDTNQIIIAFMGTEFLTYNLITDLKYFLKSYPICKQDCEIHRGFMDHYKSFENDLIKHVVELNKDYPSASVIVTGHSLGGAIATLALIKLEVILPSDVSFTLITFGSPKVGNAAFAEYMNHLRSP